jgi:hypothetical protein
LALVLLYGLILIAPGMIYQSLIFRAPTPASSLALLRGQAVDLITMFVPTQHRLLFAKLLHLGPVAWEGAAFYGTGQNAEFNFVGFTGPVLGLVGVIVTAVKKLRLRRMIFTLGAVWIVGFVLSLGPSLKVADTRPNTVSASRYSVWSMAPEWATVSLPTEVLFRLPVVSTMRYTYRWQLMSRFALAALLGLLLVQLYPAKKMIASVLCLLVVFENLPAGVLSAQLTPVFNRAYGQAFQAKVLMPLRPYVEDQRVLFLPASNDYLINLVAPLTRTYAYNVAFDKEFRRIRPLQPKPVIAAERRFADGMLEALDVCKLIRNDFADKVIFTYFSLNKGWSRDPATVAAYRQKAALLGLSEFPGLETHEEAFFLVVGADPQSGKCSPP